MDQQCRLCLEHCCVDDSRTIFDEEFRQKLLDVFTFTVEMNPKLSTLVCGQCSIQITDFHVYSVRVRANQQQLLLLAEGSVQNDLFEVVKVEASEKELLHEEETGNDPEKPQDDSLIDTGTSITRSEFTIPDTPENGPGQQEELDGKVSATHKMRRRKSNKGIAKSTLVTTVRRQRRNEANQRIQRFFKMECDICSTDMGSFSNLQLHYRKVHNSIGYIRCCDKVLTRRAQLLEHICVHEGVLRCDVCQKSYKCSRSLNLHKQNSHGTDEDKPFKCDKCHQSYPKQHLLTAHLVRHVQERCTICEKTLSSSQALKVHIAQVHGEDSNQICATCGKEFRTKRAMDRHIKEHLGLEVVDKVQCHICEKWFNGKYNLKKHVRFIHTEEGQDFQCDICNQKYPNTRALSYHKQRVHVEEKFGCEYCGKRFKRKIYLKEHTARHTGQPLYSCDACDATFNSNGNLYAHRRSKHAECRDQPAATIRRQRPKSEIVADEQLPEFFCEKCRTNVTAIYDYLRQVQVNQEQLLKERRGNHIEALENIQLEALADLDSFDRTEKNELGLETKSKRMLLQVECNSVSISFESECKPETSNSELKPRRLNQRQAKRTPVRRLEHFKDESLAKRHENDERIKEFFNLECEVCSAPVEDFTQLLEHNRQVHKTKGYVRCCDKQYFRRYLLLDHILAHRGTIRCEMCKKSYKSRRSLALHMVKMHSPEEHRPFKCDKCHVSFPKEYLLRAHELLHIKKQCRICQKVLSNYQSLKVHIAKIHGDDGNHICATCGEVFRTKPAMERHIKAHLGLELVERLQCENCKKWFNGMYNLRKHIRFLHNEEGQVFRCEICQHVSPNSRALSNHKQRIHVEEKFECEYCGKRFKHRPNLREHIASHTGNPLYSCEICGVTFNSKANYFKHRKNKHPVEWAAQKRIRSIREMSKN